MSTVWLRSKERGGERDSVASAADGSCDGMGITVCADAAVV